MKRVLILGATSEVAIALAEILASQSMELILAARNVERLKAVESDLKIRFGASLILVEFDATAPQSHALFYKQLEPKPDTVISFLGYLGNHEKGLINWDECSQILTTNYVGVVSILNEVASDFEKKKTGIIVGVSSVAGERGRQSNYLYGSAKAGFTAYLSGLRNRLSTSNVHVLTVKPGFMKTKMLADMKTPGFLTLMPNKAAQQIVKAINKKKNVAYISPIWKWVMLVIKTIPEPIFKRLKL